MTKRIGLAFSLLVGLLVLALAVPMVVIYRNNQYDSLELGLERDALVIASDLSESAVAQWPAKIAKYQSETGVRVTAVDRQSRIVVDSEGVAAGTPFVRPELQDGLKGKIVTGVRFSNTLNQNLRTVVVPIRDENQVRGALRLSVPEAAIEDQVRRLEMALIFILLAVLVVAVLVSWAVARALNRPLQRLVVGAQRVGEDPSARVGDVRGPHEIQNVADALDETATSLSGMIENSRVVAAEASHQLRTPLAAMRLRLENLAETMPTADAEQAEAAIDEVDRLTRRIDQIMALATSEVPQKSAVVDVGQLAHQRVIDWQVLASDRSIELDCEYVAAPIRAPVGAVDRVLDELVSNALAYADSKVVVRVREGGDGVFLAVGDDGPGIPVDERERVFERFQRGRKAIPGGSGLGLALVSQAVAASAGIVRIDDVPQGTVVEVWWPNAN